MCRHHHLFRCSSVKVLGITLRRASLRIPWIVIWLSVGANESRNALGWGIVVCVCVCVERTEKEKGIDWIAFGESIPVLSWERGGCGFECSDGNNNNNESTSLVRCESKFQVEDLTKTATPPPQLLLQVVDSTPLFFIRFSNISHLLLESGVW